MSENRIYYGWKFGRTPNPKYVHGYSSKYRNGFDISSELRNWFFDTKIGYGAAVEQRDHGWTLIIEIPDDIEFAIFRLAFPDL